MQTTPATDSLDTIALSELPPVTGGAIYACPPVHVAPPRPPIPFAPPRLPVHPVAPTPCFPPLRFNEPRFPSCGFGNPYDRGFPGFGFYY